MKLDLLGFENLEGLYQRLQTALRQGWKRHPFFLPAFPLRSMKAGKNAFASGGLTANYHLSTKHVQTYLAERPKTTDFELEK